MLGGASRAEHTSRGRHVANQNRYEPCLVLFARPRISGGAWFLARDEKRARVEIDIGGVCDLWRRYAYIEVSLRAKQSQQPTDRLPLSRAPAFMLQDARQGFRSMPRLRDWPVGRSDAVGGLRLAQENYLFAKMRAFGCRSSTAHLSRRHCSIELCKNHKANDSDEECRKRHCWPSSRAFLGAAAAESRSRATLDRKLPSTVLDKRNKAVDPPDAPVEQSYWNPSQKGTNGSVARAVWRTRQPSPATRKPRF